MCIYTHTCVHIYIYAYVYIYICIHMYILIYKYIHTCKIHSKVVCDHVSSWFLFTSVRTPGESGSRLSSSAPWPRVFFTGWPLADPNAPRRAAPGHPLRF